MIIKTVFTYRRTRRTWPGSRFRKDDTHIETYRRVTWRLLGIIPLYIQDTLVGNNL